MDLKGFRTSKGISQKDIASVLKITQSAYSKKEKYPNSFKPSELLVISQEFNISISSLYKMLNII